MGGTFTRRGRETECNARIGGANHGSGKYGASIAGAARAGVLRLPRAEALTPVFMPVGTAGTVKAMLPQSVAETGARIILGNTYHLMLRPGAERVARAGGLHRLMNWPHSILTDS